MNMDSSKDEVLSPNAEYARQQAGLSKTDLKQKINEEKKTKPIPVPNSRKWLDRIKRSEKIRKPFIEDADRYMRMYQGDYNWRPKRDKRNFETMSVNLVYAHIETITPSIFSGFPEVKVLPKPKVGESLQAAEVRAKNMELVLNYWFKELAIDEELDQVLFDSFFGPAIVELGWESDITLKKEVFQDEEGNPQEREIVEEIRKDAPYIKRQEFKCIYFDPDARRRKDIRWLAVEEVMTYNDFLASPKYTEYAKKKIKPQMYPVDTDQEQNYMDRPEDRGDKEWVQIYTIWDKDSRRVYAVSKGCEKFINSDDAEGKPWPYELEYKSDPFPFAILDAKRDKVSPYTWSEFKAAEPQILELNRIRSAMQIHVKRSIPKYVYTDAAGTRGDISKLMNSRSDEATKLQNLDAIRPFQVAEIPAPLYDFNNMAKDDLKVVQGTTQFESGNLADTATEASILDGRDKARKSYRTTKWEQYVVEIAGKLAQLCQQNMSQAVAVQIAGQNGIEWLSVSKEDIQGEFYFDIEPGIMEYKNEGIRKQQLLKFAEITRGNPNVNERAIIQKLAQEFDIDVTSVIVPEDQMPPGEPPEPNIQFKDIDPATITDPRIMNAIIVAGLGQNGVQIPPELAAEVQGTPTDPGAAPPEQGGLPPLPADSFGGKVNLSPNGNENLPPVEGNLMDLQPGF